MANRPTDKVSCILDALRKEISLEKIAILSSIDSVRIKKICKHKKIKILVLSSMNAKIHYNDIQHRFFF